MEAMADRKKKKHSSIKSADAALFDQDMIDKISKDADDAGLDDDDDTVTDDLSYIAVDDMDAMSDILNTIGVADDSDEDNDDIEQNSAYNSQKQADDGDLLNSAFMGLIGNEDDTGEDEAEAHRRAAHDIEHADSNARTENDNNSRNKVGAESAPQRRRAGKSAQKSEMVDDLFARSRKHPGPSSNTLSSDENDVLNMEEPSSAPYDSGVDGKTAGREAAGTETDSSAVRSASIESASGNANSASDDDVIVSNRIVTKDFYAPDWAASIRSKLFASVAHAFLLYGNVRDYMVNNMPIKDGIVRMFDPDYDYFDIIAEYDQAHGLFFYGDGITVSDGGTLADVYRRRFIEQMREAQKRLSIPVTDGIPNKDAVQLFTIISDLFNRPSNRVDDDGRNKARMLLFIDHSDLLVPDASSAQMKPDERKLAITLTDIGRSQEADNAGNCLVFITDDITQLSTRIRSTRSRIEQVKVPLPGLEEREEFIDRILDIPDNTLSDGTQVFEHPDSIDKHTLAINSAGLSCMQIEDIMLRAKADDEPLTLDLMKERKNDIIREDYDDVLEIVDPDFGFERIGGLQSLKDLFKEEIIEPIQAGDKEAVPMGVLLAGAPGSSKPCFIEQNIIVCNRISDNKISAPKWETIGDLEPGDYVAGIDGTFYLVDGIVPKPDSEIYEIELKDGRVVRTSGDHPFQVLVRSHGGEWKKRLMTPEEMLSKGIHVTTSADRRRGYDSRRSRFQMPMCSPVDMPERELEVPPYVLGAFLGDGCHNKDDALELSSADPELVEHIAELLGGDCKKNKGESYTWHFYINEYNPASKHNRRIHGRDVSERYASLLTDTYAIDKYIPEEYKLSSVKQRWELIRGMMDTDGSITCADGRYMLSFGSISKRLCEDLMEVVYSLGMSCSLKTRVMNGTEIKGSEKKFGKKYYYKHDLYMVLINVPNDMKEKFFWLPRKKSIALEAKSASGKRRVYSRMPIKDVRATGRTGHMRCIHCTAPDHLFLIGDYVPTHNTMLSKAVAHESNMNFVALNLNKIMDKWVGSTERNLDRALECAVAMAPTIIFIDEIDEALPNRADPNQSSVNKRINQRLLTFFSETEHRGDVMILAATNYPEKIDPAFKRAGRFDMRIPMFAPDNFDRVRIINVIAKSRGYTFFIPDTEDHSLEDPDMIVKNPFTRLKEWIESGNAPVNERFVGEPFMYSYRDKLDGGRHDVYLPGKLRPLIGKRSITLQQLYEGASILFEDMRERQSEGATGEVETDESYFRYMRSYLEEKMDIIGDRESLNELYRRLVIYERVYKPFFDQTAMMTGAELDVVMNKSITLWKRWMRRSSDAKFEEGIKRNQYRNDHDIPWRFLYDACHKTVSASAGIKKMEDSALLNTSDIDYIPDALYAKTDDGREISYRERHEELVMNENKSTLG